MFEFAKSLPHLFMFARRKKPFAFVAYGSFAVHPSFSDSGVVRRPCRAGVVTAQPQESRIRNPFVQTVPQHTLP